MTFKFEYDEEIRKNVIYDPWHLLGLMRPSQHCEEKKERVIEYIHTGETRWKCDCGHISEWV